MEKIKHNYNEEALAMHAEHHGKIELKNKVPLTNRDDLSRAYTPGVGAVCMAIAAPTPSPSPSFREGGNSAASAFSPSPNLGEGARRADEGEEGGRAELQRLAARKYTLKRNTVAIVSDGSAVLGLGNIGPLGAIPVMEGKAAILKEFARVDAFPICLDTQDTEEIIKAVKQIAPVFGAINLEDIAAPRCFEIEERLRKELDIPIMHDDQWGTATVVLAGMINAMKLRGLDKETVKVIVNGVGSAGVAVSRLLLSYGIKDILFVDSKGLIHKGRSDLNKEKVELLEASSADISAFGSAGGSSPKLVEVREGVYTLSDAMRGRDVFIGLSKPGTVTAEMVRSMNEKPIIFSLANPVPEIMPEEAHAAGVFIMATGRSDYPNQLNNSLIFPGLFKGMLDNDVRQFDISIFMRAALALANHVVDPSTENILPNMFDKELVEVISKSVVAV